MSDLVIRRVNTDSGALKVVAFEHGTVILSFESGSHESSIHVTHDVALSYATIIQDAIEPTTNTLDEMDNSVEESARKARVTPSGIEE